MFTRYHAQVAAFRVLRSGHTDVALTRSLAAARVDLQPHQVEAALVVLGSPLSRGTILADEVGLGKTIEAGLVIAQRWAERLRRILLIVPAALRPQWAQELHDKFALTAAVLDTPSYKKAVKTGQNPFDRLDAVLISSYEFAARNADDLRVVPWDLVVLDEAHRVRNVSKSGGASRAKKLKEVLTGRHKLLLTATPFQNHLVELFGLVSFVDDRLFGSEEAFRILYGGKPDRAKLAKLAKRLSPIYVRHLRRDIQAAGHIQFTDRALVTVAFEPADREVVLYKAVSSYLQRPGYAFGDKPNPLVLTVARKILGSSTAAIAGFLARVLERLRAHRALDLEALADELGVGDRAAETPRSAEPMTPSIPTAGSIKLDPGSVGPAGGFPVDGELAAEIEEVEGYLELARSASTNAKGDMLVSRLPGLLDEIETKGGKRKAVIFTESVRTQRYLADILTMNGHAGRIVLLNGSNSDPDSRRVYEGWLARHAGTERISGSRTADMKTAVVDAFRSDDATILIATESGAEGLNLQFCSLLVNYDLPWNPQKIEQRIGRCHRYGQRLNVVVVNFLNLRNRAEERVHQLLRDKFHLFEGVFGASDGVLGMVASGMNIEREILDIVQSCPTDAEIEAAFDELTARLSAEIDAAVMAASRRVLEALDHSVVRRLQARGAVFGELLDDVARDLMTIARVELPEARFHDDRAPCFDHEGQTWTASWSVADEKGWRFFRLGDGTLASELAERALARKLSVGSVVFDPGALRVVGLPGFADVDRLKGRDGWMHVSHLTLGTDVEAGRPREALVVAALTDDGEKVDAATVERLFFVPGVEGSPPAVGLPLNELAELERAHEVVCVAAAREQNARWLDEETQRLEEQAEDLMRADRARAEAIDAEIATARKTWRSNDTIGVEEKVRELARIKILEKEHDIIQFESLKRRSVLRERVNDNLDRIAASLVVRPEITPLFTLRWSVRGLRSIQ